MGEGCEVTCIVTYKYWLSDHMYIHVQDVNVYSLSAYCNALHVNKPLQIFATYIDLEVTRISSTFWALHFNWNDDWWRLKLRGSHSSTPIPYCIGPCNVSFDIRLPFDSTLRPRLVHQRLLVLRLIWTDSPILTI